MKIFTGPKSTYSKLKGPIKKEKFECVFINKRTNEHINKEFTVAQIDKYLGEYIKDRAIKRGHTTTTVVKRGDNWKVTITYSKP